jgi:hypothetical protein
MQTTVRPEALEYKEIFDAWVKIGKPATEFTFTKAGKTIVQYVKAQGLPTEKPTFLVSDTSTVVK